jgi:hypothetical protein
MAMLGGLMRLAVFRMLPRRILPLLLLYDVYRMFRRRATDHRMDRIEQADGATGATGTAGRSSGGRW